MAGPSTSGVTLLEVGSSKDTDAPKDIEGEGPESLSLCEAHSTYIALDAPHLTDAASESKADNSPDGPALPDPSQPLRPLTSLNWPYVPEEPAYPDPLKRDDPKSLQLHQYEAIGTCPYFLCTSLDPFFVFQL